MDKYVITGVQLGIIKGLLKSKSHNPAWETDINEVIDSVLEKQFLYSTHQDVFEVIKKCQNCDKV